MAGHISKAMNHWIGSPTRWVEPVAHVALAVLAAVLCILYYLNYRTDLEFARQQFVSSNSDASRQVSAEVRSGLRDVYQGLRTVARLPAVQSLDRSGEALDADARQAIQEVYNNLANNVAMSEVYIVPADFDPDAIDPRTSRGQEPIVTFDEFIVGRNADDPNRPQADDGTPAIEEIEIHEWRVIREQLSYLAARYPTIQAVAGLDYPAVGGPEVVTCDNTRYSPSAADDLDRSGLVYSVPIYDAQGAFHGAVTGVVLSRVLSEMLPAGDYALHNAEHGYTVWPPHAGQAKLSGDSVRRGLPDPRLAYSEVIALANPDSGPGWVLWAGKPDVAFTSMPEVRAERTLAMVGYVTTVMLAVLGAGVIHFSMQRRVALEAQVARRTAQLESAIRALAESRDNERRFTGDAAHELRTPLAALKTQAQVAQRAGDEQVRTKALQFVVDGVDRTTRLVTQLLTLARMDPLEAPSVMVAVNLADVAARVVAEFAATASYGHRKLSLDADGDYHVTGDEAVLEILLRNLVDNALRYSGPYSASEVTVRLRSDRGSTIALEVADSGPGIPADQRQRVKDRFYRAPGSQVPGAGLGLSIVQRIAEVHGAAVDIFGPPECDGTLVRVTLTRSAAESACSIGETSASLVD